MPRRLLLVDDDIYLLDALKPILRGAGYDVDTATRGKEALEKIFASFPDLIVVDAVMPEMNGFDLVREIRKFDTAKKIPIIMLTGLRSETDKLSARGVGVTEFLNKPVKGEDLLKRVQFHLRTKLY
jgi:DNA-binding response OmpR family regulator